MSKTITNYLRLDNMQNRRSSIHAIPKPNNFGQVRPRSCSIGNIGYINNDLTHRTPSPYENRSYSYETEKNDFDSPVMIITGKSPSVLECAGKEYGKKKRTTKKFAITVILLIVAAFGIVGLILSKTLPRSNAYCIGEHFCVPAKFQSSKNLNHTKKNLQPEEKKNTEKRIPKTIPKVVGKLEISKAKDFEFSTYDNPSNDNFVEKLREMKESRSRFMRQERDIKNVHLNELEDQWDSRSIVGPPGVDPRIYIRYDL